MIYFLVDRGGEFVKIGHATRRNRPAGLVNQSPNAVFYGAIAGTKSEEGLVLDYFRRQGLHRPPGDEVFCLEGELREYLEWLGTRAFFVTSLDAVDDVHLLYPAANRFPWQSWRQDDALRDGTQAELDLAQSIPNLRSPLTLSGRILATLRSDSDEWYTPPLYVDAARRVMGGIDLDPASNGTANVWIRAAEIYTAAEDSLRFPWHGRVWMNPPYGDEKDEFVAHLLDEHDAGRVTQAVVCLNAHATDTVWFQSLWRFPVCLTHHRVPFRGGSGRAADGRGAPTTGTAFVYLGPCVEEFAAEFSEFGPVLRPIRMASTDPSEFRRGLASRAWDFDSYAAVLERAREHNARRRRKESA